MQLFYGNIFENTVEINPDDQHHLRKVLRMSEGDEIAVTNGLGAVATGKLRFEGKKAGLEIIEIRRNTPNFKHHLHLALAPTKNIDRTEFFVEKAIEMGAAEISFLHTENSERKHLNLERIQKKAIAACKQSQRFYFPTLHDMVKLPDFLQNCTPQKTFVAHCHSDLQRKTLSEISIDKEICFLIGPEGDFSKHEIQLLKEKNIAAVSLGFQRLRTETAGIFVAAWSYEQMLR